MQHKAKSLINNKTFFIVMLVFTLILSGYEFSAWQKRRNVEKEIAEITLQAKKYEDTNKELSQSLSFLQTTASRERVARQQLNMKKDGEIVVNFGDAQIGLETAVEHRQVTSNPQKWWDYFLGDAK